MRDAFTILLLLTISYLGAQSTDVPLNSPLYEVLSERDVKSSTPAFTTIKPISRRVFASSLDNDKVKSSADRYDQQMVTLETREYLDSVPPGNRPLFNRFFIYPTDLFAYRDADFDLHVNPVVVLGAGRETDSRFDELLFENYRGLEIRGTIDQKVSFYTMLTENQARYPEYVLQVKDSTLGVPYEGFWKQYRDTGVDFLRARAYVDFNATEHIGVQFGYGKHFIGDGRRSLILSDVGNNYPYLRLNTQVWKIQYTNLFAQLVAETTGGTYGLDGIGAFHKKYLSTHHLSVNVAKNITVGLFESVIYGDSTGGLKVEYLNPLIFYRALEQQDGSADNVLLGLDFKANLWKKISLYGQLVIDELIVGEVFRNSGWWGNKQGFQLGAKYYDLAGISDLNGRLEWNRVRPYVYGHESNFTSYSHYNMALAHPLGANFNELLLSLNYRPLPRLKLQADLLNARYGNDRDGLSYGRNILRSYEPANRPGDYGNDIFQGMETELLMVQGKLTYLIMPNMQAGLELTYRTESNVRQEVSTTIFGLSFRWNFPDRSYLF